jgi:hypothetical protein
LGTCIPFNILGSSGYITTHQNRIEKLGLFTNGACCWCGSGLDGFSQLRHLREFSWRGFNWELGLNILKSLLHANREHLEVLELEFTDGYRFLDQVPLFTNDALRSILYPSVVPSLQVLSLSYMSFEAALEGIPCPLCLPQLRSLKLHCCPYALGFLNAVVNSSNILSLKSFEISFDEQSEDHTYRERPVQRFLQAFEGLEELFMAMENTLDNPESFMDSILHHKSTLRRWVQHHRGDWPNQDDDFFETIRDFDEGWSNRLGSIFSETKLESVGLCIEPSALV